MNFQHIFQKKCFSIFCCNFLSVLIEDIPATISSTRLVFFHLRVWLSCLCFDHHFEHNNEIFYKPYFNEKSKICHLAEIIMHFYTYSGVKRTLGPPFIHKLRVVGFLTFHISNACLRCCFSFCHEFCRLNCFSVVSFLNAQVNLAALIVISWLSERTWIVLMINARFDVIRTLTTGPVWSNYYCRFGLSAFHNSLRSIQGCHLT